MDLNIDDSSSTLRRQVALAVSFSHSGFFTYEKASVSANYHWSDAVNQIYISSIADSEIRTYGGPTINSNNFTLTEWTEQIRKDLVAIDKDGFSLDYIITPQTFPEIGEGIIQDVSRTVQFAINTYFFTILIQDVPNRTLQISVSFQMQTMGPVAYLIQT